MTAKNILSNCLMCMQIFQFIVMYFHGENLFSHRSLRKVFCRLRCVYREANYASVIVMPACRGNWVARKLWCLRAILSFVASTNELKLQFAVIITL